MRRLLWDVECGAGLLPSPRPQFSSWIFQEFGTALCGRAFIIPRRVPVIERGDFRVDDDGEPDPELAPCIREREDPEGPDRKSTRLNSSHGYISYAVFC